MPFYCCCRRPLLLLYEDWFSSIKLKAPSLKKKKKNPSVNNKKINKALVFQKKKNCPVQQTCPTLRNAQLRCRSLQRTPYSPILYPRYSALTHPKNSVLTPSSISAYISTWPPTVRHQCLNPSGCLKDKPLWYSQVVFNASVDGTSKGTRRHEVLKPAQLGTPTPLDRFSYTISYQATFTGLLRAGTPLPLLSGASKYVHEGVWKMKACDSCGEFMYCNEVLKQGGAPA